MIDYIGNTIHHRLIENNSYAENIITDHRDDSCRQFIFDIFIYKQKICSKTISLKIFITILLKRLKFKVVMSFKNENE